MNPEENPVSYTPVADWPHMPGRNTIMAQPTELRPQLYTLTIDDRDGQEISRLTSTKAYTITREVEDFIQREGLDNTGGRGGRRGRGQRAQIDQLIRGEGPIELQGFTIHVTITKGA